ncbi:MAG: 50S ribosomal protein L15 [Bacteroidota bacterium]
MNLNTLKPAAGSTKNKKRIGRGQGSGHGGTSTRGMNGAGSRSGAKSKRGFEGGQMPLQRRVPKYGFTNPFRVEFAEFNLDALQLLVTKHNLKEVNFDAFKKLGLVQRNEPIKILGRGELTAKLNITVNAASAKAKEAIEKAGGTLTLLEKK